MVHRVEDELQLKVFVVGGGDRHFDGTDFAGHFSIFRIELCQCQHAFFKLYDRLVVIVPTLRNKGNISLTIAYRAIFAPGQSGQYIIEVIGVRLTCAVDYVQCADRVIHGHGGLIDLERLILQLRAVQCKVLLGRAVVKDIALILQLDGEGDSLFGFACIGGIIVGVEHLIICTLSQPKRSTSIIAVRALKCDFRVFRQICRSIVCLNDVADRSRYFERSDIPLGRLASGIIAVVCCLDGQRTGAYIVGAAAAGNGVIHIFFQRSAFVYHVKRRHAGRSHIIKGRFIAIGECDLGIAEIRLGDGQLLFGALHRVAVFGGGEINAVFSNRVTRQVYNVVPAAANLLIFSFPPAVWGHVVSNDLPGVDVYIRTLRIAAGAELDGRAALHLRRVAGQVLAIDLQIQGLGRDGQAIDDNVVQLRAFDIIRGVPLVSAVRARDLEAKAGGLLQDVLPLRTLCQRQCADHGGKSRPGEFCTLVGNDLINAGCGRVLRVAQGGGVAARSRFDRHCALDGVAVQVKSRVLRAVDGIIAGHVGQQREFCAAVSVCVKGCLQISKSPLQAAALAMVQGCFSHRGRAAVGAGSGAFVKAVLAAVVACGNGDIAEPACCGIRKAAVLVLECAAIREQPGQ